MTDIDDSPEPYQHIASLEVPVLIWKYGFVMKQTAEQFQIFQPSPLFLSAKERLFQPVKVDWEQEGSIQIFDFSLLMLHRFASNFEKADFLSLFHFFYPQILALKVGKEIDF